MAQSTTSDQIAFVNKKPKRLFMLAFCSALVCSSSTFTVFAPTFRHCFPTTIRKTHLHMTKTVLVPIADGSEEIETTCITDTLTRFGAAVTVASVKKNNDLVCRMSRGIQFKADCSINDETIQKTNWDLVVLPGGMPGAEHLRDCEPLILLLQQQKAAGKQFGAICAAPAVVLASKGLIGDTVPATCYPAPAFREKIVSVSDEAVVVSGNLTTSQGPGTALAFALQLGENLFGKKKRDEIAKQMLM